MPDKSAEDAWGGLSAARRVSCGFALSLAVNSSSKVPNNASMSRLESDKAGSI